MATTLLDYDPKQRGLGVSLCVALARGRLSYFRPQLLRLRIVTTLECVSKLVHIIGKQASKEIHDYAY
jgi:hypothetical protein